MPMDVLPVGVLGVEIPPTRGASTFWTCRGTPCGCPAPICICPVPVPICPLPICIPICPNSVCACPGPIGVCDVGGVIFCCAAKLTCEGFPATVQIVLSSVYSDECRFVNVDKFNASAMALVISKALV